MRYYHYSSSPLKNLRNVRQEKGGLRFKPKGLWFSAGDGEDGWEAWCRAEGFGLDRLKHKTELTFKPSAQILKISSPGELDEFYKKYKEATAYGLTPSPNWEQVAREYDAIVIAPYLFERRFGKIWYYTWDCASGCVWNAANVIDSVQQINKAA